MTSEWCDGGLMGAPRTGMPDPVLMGGWMNGDGGGDGRCSGASPGKPKKEYTIKKQ